MSEWVDVLEEEAQPGDWAQHKYLDLDPRVVARVTGNAIYLRFVGDVQGGPFARSNYTYRRLAGE